MRLFLVITSFITAFLYFLIYALYDNILAVFGSIDVTGAFISFLKIFILVIVSFLIGLIVILLLKIRYEKSHFDYRFLLIVGILPFIFLILSQGAVTNLIIVKVFNSNRQISEFVFYFLSRQIVWAMWLGFALGTSVRLSFKRKIKHEASYKMEQASRLF
ncbi:MAG TPA: hypothetical protein VF347_04430 [Candidatus Humimicrobiaceae bacterium]